MVVDEAIIGGLARLNDRPVMVIGQDTHGDVSSDKVLELLDNLESLW